MKDFEAGRKPYNASVQNAVDIGDTIKRIDGTEVALTTPWLAVAKPQRASKTAASEAPKAEVVAATGTTGAAAGPGGGPATPDRDSAGKVAPTPKTPTPKTPAAKASAAKAPAKPAPQPLAAVAMPEAGVKPKAMKAARKGKADDLQKIEGIGPVLERLCHELGIFHFDQIAAWGPAEIAWMDSNLKGFRGRVSRDKWVAQAKLIGEIGMEAFLIRAKTNEY